MAPEARERATEDLRNFIGANQAALRAAQQGHPDYDSMQFAHDYWLTRNRHGSGFWDRGLGDIGDKLTEAAHADGSVDLELGDDCKIHML